MYIYISSPYDVKNDLTTFFGFGLLEIKTIFECFTSEEKGIVNIKYKYKYQYIFIHMYITMDHGFKITTFEHLNLNPRLVRPRRQIGI